MGEKNFEKPLAMTKELDKILRRLHSEYVYDPVVPESLRHWYIENARVYLIGYLKQYAQFEPEINDFILL